MRRLAISAIAALVFGISPSAFAMPTEFGGNIADQYGGKGEHMPVVQGQREPDHKGDRDHRPDSDYKPVSHFKHDRNDKNGHHDRPHQAFKPGQNMNVNTNVN